MFPLALLLAVLQPRLGKPVSGRLVWVCLVVAAFLEPLFQVAHGFADKPRPWVDAYVGLHVFVFNLAQLYVFRRYDFVSMFLCRIVYYLCWHIVWGYLRLQWLF